MRKKTLLEFGEAHVAVELAETHGEVGVLHLSGQRILQVVLEAPGRKDVQLGFG